VITSCDVIATDFHMTSSAFGGRGYGVLQPMTDVQCPSESSTNPRVSAVGPVVARRSDKAAPASEKNTTNC